MKITLDLTQDQIDLLREALENDRDNTHDNARECEDGSEDQEIQELRVADFDVIIGQLPAEGLPPSTPSPFCVYCGTPLVLEPGDFCAACGRRHGAGAGADPNGPSVAPLAEMADDVCQKCGKHLGYGVQWLHLGICEDCK